ncbi:hypothetical protein C0991_006928, partial [Blastosporella zonata]
ALGKQKAMDWPSGVVGPSNDISDAPPTLGTDASEEMEVDLGGSILGVPKSIGAAESEGLAESGILEASKLTWHHGDEPATNFKRLSQKLANIEDKETALALSVTELEAKCTQQQYKLLRTHIILGGTRGLQETLKEIKHKVKAELLLTPAFPFR